MNINKIKNIENMLNQITKKGNHLLVIRNITPDGRLMDNNHYLLSEKETMKIKNEDEETERNGGLIVNVVSYYEPKLRNF